jgi:hypothetical protein
VVASSISGNSTTGRRIQKHNGLRIERRRRTLVDVAANASEFESDSDGIGSIGAWAERREMISGSGDGRKGSEVQMLRQRGAAMLH